MLNILAIEDKKKILSAYRLRLATVVVFAFSILVLSSLILLVPSYFLAVSKYNSTATELSILESKEGIGGQVKNISSQINGVNAKINIFLKGGSASTLLSPSQVVSSVLSLKNNSIKLRGVTYDINQGQERIVISGTALERDGLASFVDTLKNEPTFTNVDLPISSYVKSTNIDFSIVITRDGNAVVKK